MEFEKQCVDFRDGYLIYRQVIRDSAGRVYGRWSAAKQIAPGRTGKEFRITYGQGIGTDPIRQESQLAGLRRWLGRLLVDRCSGC